MREYTNRKREKDRAYKEGRKKKMRIRYRRSRGYIEDDDQGIMEAKSDGIADESEGKGGESKAHEKEESKEVALSRRLESILDSYTTIQRILHTETFSLPYVKSGWDFNEEDTPSLCLFETTDGRGFGVKTAQEIPRNAFVIEFVGELIDAEMKDTLADTKYIFEVLADVKNKYPAMYIYPNDYGNMAKFINHSCQPNCWAVNVPDGCTRRLAIMTCQKIKAGEEITIKYSNDKEYFREYFRCNCKSKRCISNRM
ncbi:hypothetical protein DVH05_014707 [Phytophthora capsici]|nr:hypothetical protein DVH05_014707 [Phytophthora capsici]